MWRRWLYRPRRSRRAVLRKLRVAREEHEAAWFWMRIKDEGVK